MWQQMATVARRQQVPLPLLRSWIAQGRVRWMRAQGEYWLDIHSVQRHMLRVALEERQGIDDDWLLVVDCAGCGHELVAPGQGWLVRLLTRQDAGRPLPPPVAVSRGSRHYCHACTRQGVWRGR